MTDRKIEPVGRWREWGAIASIVVLVAVVFGDAIVSTRGKVASSPDCDVAHYFAATRAYGFGQLRDGHIPLWNPGILCGTPYLGGFQSALFYPPNLIYLALPLPLALNIEIAAHVLLLGLLMYWWTRSKGMGVEGAFWASAMAMFCGPFFLKVLAGHLTMIDAFAWTPLIFLAIDKCYERPTLSWTLAGVLAVSMQILAGLPQTVLCSALVAALYCACHGIPRKAGVRVSAALATIALLPLFLTAVQLWPGIETARECTRSLGVEYACAASYSFPPENLLTTILPGIFGDFRHFPYWGRGYVMWEAVFFTGITGVALALSGTIQALRCRRVPSVRLLAMLVVLLAIAMGRHTPLFRFLYAVVPGFDRFRAPSRFLFHATLLLALFAGLGLDGIVRGKTFPSRGVWALVALSGALFFSAAFLLAASRSGHYADWWGRLVDAQLASGEIAPLSRDISSLDAGRFAARGLLVAGCTAVLLAILAGLTPRFRWGGFVIVILGVFELLVFARLERSEFHLEDARDSVLADLVRAYPGEHRVLDFKADNNGIWALGGLQAWGYEPVLLRRFAQFMAFSQGDAKLPLGAGPELKFRQIPSVYRMLRCMFVVTRGDENAGIVGIRDVLPRFLLLHDYRVIPDRDQRLAALMDPAFNPATTVVVEDDPKPVPDARATGGSGGLLSETSDMQELEVELDSPAILLVTDAFSEAWRILPVDGGTQCVFKVLPANHVLRAVPLSAGRHHFRMVYTPSSYGIGKNVSVVAAALLAAVSAGSLALALRKRAAFVPR